MAVLALALLESPALADTVLHLGADGPSLPAITPQGTWDASSRYVVRRLDAVPSERASVNRFPVNVASAPLLAYVGVSRPLAADTVIDTTVSWFLNLAQHDAELSTTLTLWAMKPDLTPRCPIASVTEDAVTMPQWPELLPPTEVHLFEFTNAVAVPTSSCAALAGDRLVAEFGGTSSAITGGEGFFGYGKQDPAEHLMPPFVALAQDIVFSEEPCTAPEIVQLTTESVHYRITEPERCAVLTVFRNAFETPVATFLRGELVPDGDGFVLPLLTDVGDAVALRCCCDSCKPTEDALTWSHAQLPSDALDHWTLLTNSVEHSSFGLGDVVALPDDAYAYATQYLNQPLCESDSWSLRVCLARPGCCSCSDGVTCVYPVAGVESCPEECDFIQNASCQ